MGVLTPEQLFFRYTWPATETLFMKRKLSEKAYRRLKVFRDNPHLCPPQELLAACFPRIFDALRICGNETGRAAWDDRNVGDYWRMFHDGPGPVRVYTVGEIRGDGNLLGTSRRQGEHPQLLSNPYSLELRQGNQIYVRMACAVEIYGER